MFLSRAPGIASRPRSVISIRLTTAARRWLPAGGVIDPNATRRNRFIASNSTIWVETARSPSPRVDTTKRFLFRPPHNSELLHLQNSPVEDKEAWLERKLEDNQHQVTVEEYLFVLKALAQSRAPQRAEEWMNRLEKDPNVQPTLECYHAVMSSWARSRQEVAVTRAERWLTKLIRSPDHRYLSPTTETYNAFLSVCARCKTKKHELLLGNAKKAQETLETMLQSIQYAPDTDSFNHVIRAWTAVAHASNAKTKLDPNLVVDKTMELLKQMESYQRSDPEGSRIKPDTWSYCMVMDAFANAAGLKATKSGMDPVLQKTNGLEEVRQVEAMLQYMHDLYDAGHEGVVPNTVAYNTLLSAWSRLSGNSHADAPFEAEKVLRKMIYRRDQGFEEALPDNISYKKVIIAWANSGHPTADRRAQWWLNRLWDEYERSDHDRRLQPHISTYCVVLRAIRKDPVKSEKLLLELLRSEEKGEYLRPNSACYAFVIHAWLQPCEYQSESAKTHFERITRAWSWLKELIRREKQGTCILTSSPDLFEGILKACSRCSGEELGTDVLDLAIACFDTLRESRHRVDFMTYTWILQIGLDALAGPEHNETRAAFIRQLVLDCRDDGLVSNAFVRALANSPVCYAGWTAQESARLTNELFETWPLPSSWHRNLPMDALIPTEQDAKRTDIHVHLHKGANLG
jgi:hypothetical protein